MQVCCESVMHLRALRRFPYTPEPLLPARVLFMSLPKYSMKTYTPPQKRFFLSAALLAALVALPLASHAANVGGNVVPDVPWTGYSSYVGDYGPQGNSVAVNGNPTKSQPNHFDFVIGGYSNSSTVEANKVDFLLIAGEAPVERVYGGYTEDGDALRNPVTIGSGTVEAQVYGGFTNGGGDALSNTITIDGGSLDSGTDVVGGFSGGGDATDNIVTLNGGSFGRSRVIGGWSVSGNASYNIVVLGESLGANALADSALYGGEAPAVSHNTLKVQKKNLSVGSVNDFATLRFILPDSFTTSDTMLTITGPDPVELTGVTINISGSMAALKSGDRLTLIDKTSGTPAGFTANVAGFSFTLDTSSGALVAIATKTDSGGDTPAPTPYYYYDDNSSPTLGDIGLLLSGIALAGAAAPALRRREKQGKKADTRQ